jgi:hypothetical protein
MKKGIILSVVILALVVSAGFSANQSGEKETRNVSGFSKVSFGVSGNLYINIGPDFKVVLEGDKDILRDILTEVSNGKLVIKKDNWRFNMNEKVTVYVTMPELKGLGVSGSGKAEIKDVIKTSDMNLSVSGSGKLYTSDLILSNLDCSISGSGDIIIGGNGSTSKADISISGSGNYSGEQLKIGLADISVSGSGNCTCNVTESLKASISGSGNVNYFGNSAKVDARVSGSGHVRSK